MSKKRKILPVAVLCIVAAIAGAAAVLTVKAKNQMVIYDETDGAGYTQAVTAETGTTRHSFFGSLFSGETEEESSVSSEETSLTDAVSETLSSIADGAESTAESVSSAAATTVAAVNEAFYKVFSLPASPKYVEKESKIDFNTASLASYKYSPSGNYYYTDDKNAWQKGFGYNKIYDNLSIAVAMYYDTVRNTFTYDGKDYLVQFWKGQYGYYFVGGEIGIYTKTSGNSYACADKSDWVNMEMTFMWDENKTGDYKAIFTRPYDQYWWCTGFVIGFESDECIKSRAQFRIVGHIQFKSTEMADAFCTAMAKNGFTEVSSLDSSKLDSFVRVGPDVGFVWQNINQHVI